MARRKNDENPVSLFAFQDIITSITGIMVLVVLLIILDIIGHKEVKSAKKTSPFKEDIEKLEQMAAGLKKQLDEGKDWMTRNEQLITQALSVDLESLPKMIDKEKKKHLRLTTGLKNLQNKNVELESLIHKTKEDVKSKKNGIGNIDKQIKDLTDDIKKGKMTLEELIAKLKNWKKRKRNGKTESK